MKNPKCQAETQPDFGKWRSIRTAPKDGSAILVLKDDVVYHVKWGGDFHRAFMGCGQNPGFVDHPTHWMPLPDLPRKKE